MELLLPDMTALEVVSRLRAEPTTASVPVLVLTAQDLAADDKRALNGQVLAVLRKADAGRIDLLHWMASLSAVPSHRGSGDGG